MMHRLLSSRFGVGLAGRDKTGTEHGEKIELFHIGWRGKPYVSVWQWGWLQAHPRDK
jgi:hypothetical protein